MVVPNRYYQNGPFPSGPFFEALGSENGPEGRVEFYIKVPKAGWYYVNSDQKSIVAIVPSSEIYIANSSWTAFTGCQNFWDFEEPLRTAQ